jgi:hypothetical protein
LEGGRRVRKVTHPTDFKSLQEFSLTGLFLQTTSPDPTAGLRKIFNLFKYTWN